MLEADAWGLWRIEHCRMKVFPASGYRVGKVGARKGCAIVLVKRSAMAQSDLGPGNGAEYDLDVDHYRGREE